MCVRCSVLYGRFDADISHQHLLRKQHRVTVYASHSAAKINIILTLARQRHMLGYVYK